MENSLLDAIYDQIFRDIYYGMYTRFVIKQKGNEQSFKGGVKSLLINTKKDNKSLGETILNRAYNNSQFDDQNILSGATLGIEIMIWTMGPNLYAQKDQSDHLKQINRILSDLFFKTVENTINLYSSPIVKRDSSDIIKMFIKKQVYDYFKNLRDKYRIKYPGQYIDIDVVPNVQSYDSPSFDAPTYNSPSFETQTYDNPTGGTLDTSSLETTNLEDRIRDLEDRFDVLKYEFDQFKEKPIQKEEEIYDRDSDDILDSLY